MEEAVLLLLFTYHRALKSIYSINPVIYISKNLTKWNSVCKMHILQTNSLTWSMNSNALFRVADYSQVYWKQTGAEAIHCL